MGRRRRQENTTLQKIKTLIEDSLENGHQLADSSRIMVSICNEVCNDMLKDELSRNNHE
jgi:hypothetical protein